VGFIAISWGVAAPHSFTIVNGVHHSGGAFHADYHIVRQPVAVEVGAAVRLQVSRSAGVKTDPVDFQIIIGAGRRCGGRHEQQTARDH
jgi:hypothetical protein